MILLPFTQYFHFLRAPKFTRSNCIIIVRALRIVKIRVNHVFIIPKLPAKLLKILFIWFLTIFYTPLFVCAAYDTTAQSWSAKIHLKGKATFKTTCLDLIVALPYFQNLLVKTLTMPPK